MMNCREISYLASERLDRKLSLAERAKFRLHLALCRHCRRYADQLVFIRRAVRRAFGREPASGPELPEEARARIATWLREANASHRDCDGSDAPGR